MPRRPATIRRLPFRHNAKPGLGFEIFRLSALLDRFAHHRVDHEPDAPQRPEFHTIYVGLRGAGHVIVDFTPVPIGAHRLTFVARGRVQQFFAPPALRSDTPDLLRRSPVCSAAGQPASRPGLSSFAGDDVDAWMLLWSPEFLLAGGDAPDPLARPATLDPGWAMPTIEVGASEARELVTIADQLDREHARPLDAVQPWLLAALLRVVVLRAERLATPAAPPPAAVQRFFTTLERDHLTTRSVAHYARKAGLSPRRLGEVLAAHTGKSTKQVIDDRVILEQKRLLVHTDLSIKELAARTGFAEPTNLVKFFRHHTQTTPLAFRAEQRRRILPSRRGS